MCLPLLISACTIKSRSSLLAPAHPGCHEKRAVKWLWLSDATSVHVVTCLCVDKRLHLLLTTWMMCKHSDGLC